MKKIVVAFVVALAILFIYKDHHDKVKREKIAQELRLQNEIKAKQAEADLKARQAEAEAMEKKLADEVSAKKANAEQSMKAVFDKMLVDPGSAQFRSIKVFLDVPTSKIRVSGSISPTTNVVCGEFNSKNRMGGYTGFKYFYWDSDKNEVFGAVDDSTLGPIMQDVAKKTCDSL